LADSRLDKHEQFILDALGRTGWSLISVFDNQPPFTYSIGLMHTFEHPEVVIFGLEIKLMSAIINGIGRMIRGGRRFEEPGLYEDILEGFACKFVPVLQKHHEEYLGYAMWHRRYDWKKERCARFSVFGRTRTGYFPTKKDLTEV
jgi:hypothetical protein